MLICVTNNLDDVRSCTIRGEHLSVCTGTTPTGKECRGCLPRPAEAGLLCWSCNEKLHNALAITQDLISHCRSIETGSKDQSGVRTPPESRVIFPASWQRADALYVQLATVAVAYAKEWGADEPDWYVAASLLTGFHPYAPIEAVSYVTEMLVRYVQSAATLLVAKHAGAEEAVRYVHEVQTALAHYPLEERSRRIRHARCRHCHHETLHYRPPIEYLDPITVTCTNPDCGAVWDPDLVEEDLHKLRVAIEEELARQETAA